MSKDHLSIDIYTDKYPKPKLVDDGLPDVIVVDDTIVIPYVFNSPTHVNSQEIVREEKTPEKTPEKVNNNDDEVMVNNNRQICATILCTLSCIGIGVACLSLIHI